MKRNVKSWPYTFLSVVLVGIIAVFLAVTCSETECVHGNCRDGRGTLSLPDGRLYSGDFSSGRMTGRGVMEFFGLRCDGNFKDGVPYGYLKFSYPDGTTYVGEYRAGKRNGRGVLVFADGTRYEGEFRDGKFNGLGTLFFRSGARYIGNFENNRFDGYGRVLFADGVVYAARFKNGRLHENYVWSGAKAIENVELRLNSERNERKKLNIHNTGKRTEDG